MEKSGWVARTIKLSSGDYFVRFTHSTSGEGFMLFCNNEEHANAVRNAYNLHPSFTQEKTDA